MPTCLVEHEHQEMMRLLLVMVCSQNYIRNPYLTAKLVEWLFVLQPSIQPKTEHLATKILLSDIAKDNLVPCLMKFYTGKFGHVVICSYLYFKPLQARGR